MDDNKPAELSLDGSVKGKWKEDNFILDDSFIPGKRYNLEQKTIGEIKEDLENRYKIRFNSIPFKDGEGKINKMAEIFKSRVVNFAEANRLAAQNHIYIETLGDKYAWKELVK